MRTTFVQVKLASGNPAVYEVEPNHLTNRVGIARRETVRNYGRQIAHKLGDTWHAPGGWTEIRDQKLIQLLESTPSIDD